MKKRKVIIIGGGAAGMMAAARLDSELNEIILLEKNEKLGKKLFITGKGRCNLTNACDMETLSENIIEGRRFMYSSLNGFNNFDVIDFFEDEGLKTKIERGNRVFPESDHSSDVIKALERKLRANGVRVLLGTEAEAVKIEGKRITGIGLKDGSNIEADIVILATGGLSYPSTGSTGDGYRFSKEAGHEVAKCYPSLTSISVREQFVSRLEGLSLKNVTATFERGGKVLSSELGEMLFTRTGVSGPIILSAQALIGAKELKKGDISLHIDLKPGLTAEQLDKRIVRDFSVETNRLFKNALSSLLPRTLIPVIVEQSGIPEDRRLNALSKEERASLVTLLKDFAMLVTGSGGFNEAVVTRGGVMLDKINPKTMQSKLCENLYFAGELMNIDAYTGGFNLQIAWSTAAAAAKAINSLIE